MTISKEWVIGIVCAVVGIALGMTAQLAVFTPKIEGVRSAMFIFDVESNQWRPLTADDLKR